MKKGCVERYVDHRGNMAIRVWAHDRVLSGGFIRGRDDFDHLKKDFGVTGVLNFEEHDTDECKGIEHLKHLPFHDDGKPIPENLIHQALDFADEHLMMGSHTVLYPHCALGGSRGPSMSYAICRGIFGMSSIEVINRITIGHPQFRGWCEVYNPHQYLKDIEAALLTWPRRRW